VFCNMDYGTEHLEVVALDRVDVYTFGLDRLCRVFRDKSLGWTRALILFGCFGWWIWLANTGGGLISSGHWLLVSGADEGIFPMETKTAGRALLRRSVTCLYSAADNGCRH